MGGEAIPNAMSGVANVLIAILGLAVLMVVHECGHLFAARAFKLRVVRFSIGFGPALWRVQARGSETEYQIALIPFMAYVQVAGMNPFEEVEPDDEGSYANASLTARISTVIGGPLANYLFASVLMFAAFMAFGEPNLQSTVVDVHPDTAAEAAQMQTGDKIVQLGDQTIESFADLRDVVLQNAGTPLKMLVQREGREVALTITPRPTGKDGAGQIGVSPTPQYEPIAFGEAVSRAIAFPAEVVEQLVVGLVRMIAQKAKPDVSGPVGIVKAGAEMVKAGPYEILYFFGMLSAYLGGFNLLPFPGLDGGRLAFLGYEAVARRRPNAKVEAQIHAFGLLMFLALIAVVTVQDFQR